MSDLPQTSLVARKQCDNVYMLRSTNLAPPLERSQIHFPMQTLRSHRLSYRGLVFYQVF